MSSWWFSCADIHKLRYTKINSIQPILDKELKPYTNQQIDTQFRQTSFKADCNVGSMFTKYDHRRISHNSDLNTVEIQYYKKLSYTEKPELVMYDIFRVEDGKLCQYKHIYQYNFLSRFYNKLKMPYIFIRNTFKYQSK